MAQEEFFTWSAFASVTVAAGAVLVATNTVRKVAKIVHPIVPFVFAVLIAFGGAYKLQKLAMWDDWAITFLNACLLFCTATGIQEVGGAAVEGRATGETKPFSKAPVKWWGSWL